MTEAYFCCTHYQDAFEQALKDGLHCAVENIHVREQIREEAGKRKQAATQARTETMIGACRTMFFLPI